MASSTFEIHESEHGGALRLTLTGELDVASAPLLARRLEELRADDRGVCLDLSELEFMDCSGVHLLLNAFRSASSDGWRFRIKSKPSRQVMRVLELTNLGRLVGDEDAVIADLFATIPVGRRR